MKQIEYNQAVNYLEKDKITAFCIKSVDCPTCDEWVKRFFKDIEEHYKNDVVWYMINLDSSVMFPPQYSPTWYIYIPGQLDPFIRDGVLPQPEFNSSMDKLERIKNGENPFHVFGR